MAIDVTDCADPCDVDDHDWQYDAGDDSVGINSGWLCKICGATNDDAPPDVDYD